MCLEETVKKKEVKEVAGSSRREMALFRYWEGLF
jgi:hypothetical protein